MQVVIVTGMIDVFLLVSHELEGKKTEKQHSRVHIQNIYARKRTHTGDMTEGSLRWRVHTECQSMQREEGKGELYI